MSSRTLAPSVVVAKMKNSAGIPSSLLLCVGVPCAMQRLLRCCLWAGSVVWHIALDPALSVVCIGGGRVALMLVMWAVGRMHCCSSGAKSLCLACELAGFVYVCGIYARMCAGNGLACRTALLSCIAGGCSACVGPWLGIDVGARDRCECLAAARLALFVVGGLGIQHHTRADHDAGALCKGS